MRFKIMNYNILHGFHSYTTPFKLEKRRLTLAQKIVHREHPDILILTEACFGGPNKTGITLNYKKLFRFPYSYWGQFGKHSAWGTFILSKYPITHHELMPCADRTLLRSRIKIKKIPIWIDIFHSHPELSDRKKVRVLRPIVQNHPTPYIFTGDFNSLSDEDTYTRATLIRGFNTFIKGPQPIRWFYIRQLTYKFLQRTLTPFLRAQGLRDAFEKKAWRTFTVPTDLISKTKHSAMRIDYFFITKEFSVIKAYVIKNNDTEYASDHYPICGIFEIN